MKQNSCEIDFNTEDEYVDYPYIGIGSKPNRLKIQNEADIEKIIAF